MSTFQSELFRIENNEWIDVYISEENEHILSFSKDKISANGWAISSKKIYFYNGYEWLPVTIKDRTLNHLSEISLLDFELKHYIILSTKNDGIFSIELSEKLYTELKENNPIEIKRLYKPNSRLGHLYVDQWNKDLYVYSNAGINQLSLVLYDGVLTKLSQNNYITEDGLFRNNIQTKASYLDSEGRFWAGTYDGLNYFYPSHKKKYTSPLTLTLNDNNFNSFESGVEIEPDNNNLRLNFSLHETKRFNETLYSTQLIPYDQYPTAYSPNSTRELINLPSGEYRVKAFAKNYNGEIFTLNNDFTFIVKGSWWLSVKHNRYC